MMLGGTQTRLVLGARSYRHDHDRLQDRRHHEEELHELCNHCRLQKHLYLDLHRGYLDP
jgi:hypothetical protein